MPVETSMQSDAQTLGPTNVLADALLTDAYEFTMAYAWWKNGMHQRNAVADLDFRRNPFGGAFTVFAGLAETIRFLAGYRFSDRQVQRLRTLLPPNTDAQFFDWLRACNLDRIRIRALREGLLAFPQHADFVLGVPGGLEATVQNLCELVDDLPAGCTWSVEGVGRQQLAMAMVAIAMGGHVRVGLEDNLYYTKGRLARNEELVARVARIAEEFGRPVATPEQARALLGLRGLAGISVQAAN